MYSSNSIYNVAILISGPRMGEHNLIQSLLKKKVPNVISIGDGKQDLLDKNSQGLYYDEISRLGQYECFLDLAIRPLIIINTHGTVRDGKHILQFGEEHLVPTKSIFDDISHTFPDIPVDILFIPCHGAGALTDVSSLVQGSKVLFISDFDESTLANDVLAVLREVVYSDKVFSISNYYEHFTIGGDTLVKVTFVEVGAHSAMKPAQFFKTKLLGHKIHKYLELIIENKISQFCNLDMHCTEKLSKALTSISYIKTFESIAPKPSKYYERVLKLEKLKREFGEQLGNAKCDENSEEVKALVKTINGILVNGSIAMQTNEALYCISFELTRHEEEAAYESIVEYYKTMSDFALLRAFLEDINTPFISNNSIPVPEKSHFGEYMLISSFIQEYCNNNPCPEFA